jgi:hypothetical protein
MNALMKALDKYLTVARVASKKSLPTAKLVARQPTVLLKKSAFGHHLA